MRLFIALAAAGCTCQSDPQMVAQFEAAKAEALAKPTAAPADWKPDARLQLSPALVQQLVQSGLESRGALTGRLELPGVTFTPVLDLEHMDLQPAPACIECVKADVQLEGTLGYDAGVLGTGEVPLSLAAIAVVELGSARTDEDWDITVKPRALRKVRLDVANMPRRLMQMGDEPLRAWAEAEMLSREPERVTSIGGDRLPLRDLRVVSAGAAINVDLLTQASKGGTLTHAPTEIQRGWQLEISTTSLVALASSESFRRGPQTALGVVAVPDRLEVHDNRFVLDLRLWRLEAPSWWRDIRVTGSAELHNGRATLIPSDAERLAASEGAGWADPLLTLAEGALLSSIATTLEQSVPAGGSAVVRGSRVDVGVKQVAGTHEGRVLQLRGSLELTAEAPAQ